MYNTLDSEYLESILKGPGNGPAQKGNAMTIIDGKLVLSKRKCNMCQDGTRQEFLRCPNYGKAQKGKPCLHCGSKTKDGHKYIETGKTLPCGYCNGTMIVEEGICDFAPEFFFDHLPIKVYRQDREGSWNETYLGHGCVFSCVDYGTAFKENDDTRIIAKVREHVNKGEQAIKFIRGSDDYTIADHIGIFVHRHGYSVRSVFGNAKEVAKSAAAEPSIDAVHFSGMNTYEAAGII
jgi:hypothetical protein